VDPTGSWLERSEKRVVLEEVVFRDRAVFFPVAGTLVLADVHLGRDRASNVELPLGERTDLLDRLGGLLDRFAPGRVVVAGDLLHSFDRLPSEVEGTLSAVERRIEESGAELVAVEGNHDTMLGSLLAVDPRCCVGDALVCHGHRSPEGSAPLYVLGHEHPAITIEGRKRPCYLVGPAADGGRALVLPAFTRLAPGTDVSRARRFRSPLLSRPGAYRPVVRDEAGDETLWFPPLSEFRAML
jgi:hypothetical protein